MGTRIGTIDRITIYKPARIPEFCDRDDYLVRLILMSGCPSEELPEEGLFIEKVIFPDFPELPQPENLQLDEPRGLDKELTELFAVNGLQFIREDLYHAFRYIFPQFTITLASDYKDYGLRMYMPPVGSNQKGIMMYGLIGAIRDGKLICYPPGWSKSAKKRIFGPSAETLDSCLNAMNGVCKVNNEDYIDNIIALLLQKLPIIFPNINGWPERLETIRLKISLEEWQIIQSAQETVVSGLAEGIDRRYELLEKISGYEHLPGPKTQPGSGRAKGRPGPKPGSRALARAPGRPEAAGSAATGAGAGNPGRRSQAAR